MKIGILTGGGDAPGLNAVIRAVVKAPPTVAVRPSASRTASTA
jgi:6-phosphofructokinase